MKQFLWPWLTLVCFSWLPLSHAQAQNSEEAPLEVQFRVILLGGVPEPRYRKSEDGSLELDERDSSHLITPTRLRLAKPEEGDESPQAKRQAKLIAEVSSSSFFPSLNRVSPAFKLTVPTGSGLELELEARNRSAQQQWRPWAKVNLTAERLRPDLTLLFFKDKPKDTWLGEKKPQMLVLDNSLSEQFPENSIRLVNASSYTAILELNGQEVRLRARSARVVAKPESSQTFLKVTLSYLDENEEKKKIRSLSKNFAPNSRALVALYNHDGDWGNFPIAMTYTPVAKPTKQAEDTQESK